MLRRGYEFEVAMAVGILGTIVAYGIGIWAAQSFGDIS
jgi:type IV secretory pathway TrbD component